MSHQKAKRILGMTYLQIGILAGLGVLLFVVVGCFGIMLLYSNLPASPQIATKPTANQNLPAKDVFEVSAVYAVKDAGYTVTSAVCEVVSSERFQPIINGVKVDAGKIVFHAFRITGPHLSSEVLVLFSSNHTAADGSGLIQTVNADAVRLFPEFPKGPKLRYPITVDTDGAQEALECARHASPPPSLDFGDFDAEAWRREAIKRFGPEQTFSDGSKDDYVRLALSICKYEEENPSMTYEEGSDQQWILETFCPYVK